MGVDAVETHILDQNRTSQLNIQETTAALPVHAGSLGRCSHQVQGCKPV